MKHKKQKQTQKPSYLALILIILFGLLINFFWNKKSEKEVTHQKESVSSSYDVHLADDHFGQNKSAPVDYYMLALSYSPAFCESQKERNHGTLPNKLKYQCADNQSFGWVVHGLWPQNANAKRIEDHPRFCQGDLPEEPQAELEKYLPISPGLNLLQAEWEKHGACAFKQADEYFAKEKALFESLNLPKESLSKRELFSWIRKNNPALNHVYLGAKGSELYICYNKNWQPIDCPQANF